MSEKLCLQWNDFKENVNSAFSRLRNDNDFTDVTLACEDGQHLEAHKVILAASSPVFEKILQKSKHPHPLIYLRGFQSKDLASILDFLYFGEANVFQEDLDSFLAIAEEIKLKGLTGQITSDLVQEEIHFSETTHKSTERGHKLKACKPAMNSNENDPSKTSMVFSNPRSIEISPQALDEKVISMMEKSQKLIPTGYHPNGMPRQQKAYICKVCGKEGSRSHLKDHIEANHLEGISFTCDFCNKTFSARSYLEKHKNKFH